MEWGESNTNKQTKNEQKANTKKPPKPKPIKGQDPFLSSLKQHQYEAGSHNVQRRTQQIYNPFKSGFSDKH